MMGDSPLKKNPGVPQMGTPSLPDAIFALAMKHGLTADTHPMQSPFKGALGTKYKYVSQIIGPEAHVLVGFLHETMTVKVTVSQAQVLARLDAYLNRHPPPQETA